MPKTTFPGGQAVDWYLSTKSEFWLQITGSVNGQPQWKIRLCYLPDEGLFNFKTSSTKSAPTNKIWSGPPFRREMFLGISFTLEWSRLMLVNLGLFYKATEKKLDQTWFFSNPEPEPAYWISGAKTTLFGLQGLQSKRFWKRWGKVDLQQEARERRIFGVQLTDDNIPIITGAVGLSDIESARKWTNPIRTVVKNLLNAGRSVVVLGGWTAFPLKTETIRG